MVKKWRRRLVAWYKANIWGLNLLLILVVLGAFLRLYKLSETFMFEGDQARDIILVRERIFSGRPIAIGPVTSVGNMYLGPFYYYFMIPWVFFSNFNPVGPAVGVALMSVLTIVLIYILGQKMLGKRAALIAALFFTFSQTAIFYARFSWNPNLSPLFGLLVLYLLWRCMNKNTYKFWPWLSLACGLLIQLHYVNLIMVGVVALVWLWQAIHNRHQKSFWLMSAAAVLIFGITLVPQVLFDLKHQGLNSQAGIEMFTGENHNFYQESWGETLLISLQEMWGKTAHVVTDLLIPKIEAAYYAKIASCVLIMVVFCVLIRREKNQANQKSALLVAAFLITTIAGVSFYQHTVFDHYLLFVLPLTSFMFGFLLAKLSRYSVGKYITVLVIIAFVIYNTVNYDFSPQGLPMSQKKRVVNYLINQAGGQAYNIIRLPDDAETGSGGDIYASKYRYLALMKNQAPVEVGDHDRAEIMFVLDENLQTSVQDVSDSPIYELVLFGRNKIVSVAQPVPDGPIIYKLVK